jgi:lambda family phage portal protein
MKPRLLDRAKSAWHGLRKGSLTVKKYYQLRNYGGGSLDRTNEDFRPITLTSDADLQNSIVMLRARCRNMAHSNPYARRYLDALKNNVLGHKGIALQMKITEPAFKGSGTQFDTVANDKIERGFAEWSKKEFCTVNGRDTWNDVQRQALDAAATAGGILIRKRMGKKWNKFGFTLQVYEVDHIDHNFSTAYGNGNFVRMGIEQDSFGKIVAFHLLKQHPGEMYFPAMGYARERVPAEEFIYYFIRTRAGQTVGAPWFTASMEWMHHLSEYQKAEIMAARAASCKGGWFQSSKGEKFQGDDEAPVNGNETTEASGNTLNDFEPGAFDELPEGMEFKQYDPTHPTNAYGDCVKTSLYGISAGLNTDYSTITGDLSQANYSSMRSGKLESQEAWKAIQQSIIDGVCIETFEPWLQMSLLMDAFDGLPNDFEKFNKPHFRGRRWPWVDPSKDISSAIMAIEYGLGARSRYTEDNDEGDFEDLIKLREYEQEVIDKSGLKFKAPNDKPLPEPGSEDPAAPPKKNGERNGHDLKDLLLGLGK